MKSVIVLALLMASVAIQQVLCQQGAVEVRAAEDKVSDVVGGGQSRTIYSPRHLSPHRMMHFGKRPSILAPPTILTPRSYDPYLAERIQSSSRVPYLFSLELDNGQTLRAVPEDVYAAEDLKPIRNLVYNVERPQAYDQQMLIPQVSYPVNRQSFSSKLVEANENTDNAVSGEGVQSPSTSNDDPMQAINVSTRSMHRGSTLNLPKAYISSLLFGRQGSSSLSSFGTYNKKAEPKDNFFMHFGRK